MNSFVRFNPKFVRCKSSMQKTVKRMLRAACLSCATILAFHANADGIKKCVVDGKVIYQDAPRKFIGEMVGQTFEKKESYEAFHRQLDRLQAQGYGLVPRPAPHPVKRLRPKQSEYFVPNPQGYASVMAEREAFAAKVHAETLEKNAKSTALLTQRLDEINKACGGKLVNYPTVGMTEDTFTRCTIHAKTSWASQIVVSKDGNTPLKLYVFARSSMSRVYIIGGVITRIKP